MQHLCAQPKTGAEYEKWQCKNGLQETSLYTRTANTLSWMNWLLRILHLLVDMNTQKCQPYYCHGDSRHEQRSILYNNKKQHQSKAICSWVSGQRTRLYVTCCCAHFFLFVLHLQRMPWMAHWPDTIIKYIYMIGVVWMFFFCRRNGNADESHDSAFEAPLHCHLSYWLLELDMFCVCSCVICGYVISISYRVGKLSRSLVCNRVHCAQRSNVDDEFSYILRCD